MPTAQNAKLQYEAGQTSVALSALTDSGDHTTFAGTVSPWSLRSGYVPVIRPNGLVTGGAITPAASGTNDAVDVAAGTAYIAGALVSWSADTDVAITRAADSDTHAITSITVTSLGAIAAVAGTDGTAFSETRAANGGPPLIPVASVELGQVRTTSRTSADILAEEIFTVLDVHTERWDSPLYDVDYFNGELIFVKALPLIHTGVIAKSVYASYASPIFADVAVANDFVPPEDSISVTSTQAYGRTIGGNTSSLGQGSFTAYLNNGVTDSLVILKGNNLWFKFYPDRYQGPYILTQGVLGVTRAFPAGDQITASCTISAESAAENIAA